MESGVVSMARMILLGKHHAGTRERRMTRLPRGHRRHQETMSPFLHHNSQSSYQCSVHRGSLRVRMTEESAPVAVRCRGRTVWSDDNCRGCFHKSRCLPRRRRCHPRVSRTVASPPVWAPHEVHGAELRAFSPCEPRCAQCGRMMPEMVGQFSSAQGRSEYASWATVFTALAPPHVTPQTAIPATRLAAPRLPHQWTSAGGTQPPRQRRRRARLLAGEGHGSRAQSLQPPRRGGGARQRSRRQGQEDGGSGNAGHALAARHTSLKR